MRTVGLKPKKQPKPKAPKPTAPQQGSNAENKE